MSEQHFDHGQHQEDHPTSPPEIPTPEEATDISLSLMENGILSLLRKHLTVTLTLPLTVNSTFRVQIRGCHPWLSLKCDKKHHKGNIGGDLKLGSVVPQTR